jgi:hypothetical protein
MLYKFEELLVQTCGNSNLWNFKLVELLAVTFILSFHQAEPGGARRGQARPGEARRGQVRPGEFYMCPKIFKIYFYS